MLIIFRCICVTLFFCLALASNTLWGQLPPLEANVHEDVARFILPGSKVERMWGGENLSVFSISHGRGPGIRVFIPKGSIDPASMKNRGLRRGGAGFLLNAFPNGVERALLSYYVRFPHDFKFVRGGKLPGLYGGTANSGGRIPNGTDGFSFRLMWGADGQGSVYAYLPTSVKWGTPFFSRSINFIPGRWHLVLQEVHLNRPDRSDGVLRVWLDGVLVGEENGLFIRSVDELKINGMFFEVFFGGSDDSWAAIEDTAIDFSGFSFRVF